MHARLLDMGRIWEQAERDVNILSRLGARFVCIVDKYPPLLRKYIEHIGLFVRGDTKALIQPSVTIVGTRGPREGSCCAASGKRISRYRCCGGVWTCSWDRCCGTSWCNTKRCWIYYCRSALWTERVYPPSNAALAAAILDCGGCLVTEYPPGVSLDRYRFPERNRILAGFSKLTLIVEAPEKSGALLRRNLLLEKVGM